ncbi:MAG: low molecular weight protein-tyrosine-phosphatase [Eubacteriales bacterium]|jgi:protein-tyrosine phosphatase
MKKILFICHGNICRSPLAEFLFRHMAQQAGVADEFPCASAAVSREELGNPVHPAVRKLLARVGISTAGKSAVRIQKDDYEKYDLLICMDRGNIIQLRRLFGADQQQKCHLLMDYTGVSNQDVDDPWYTGDFEKAYQEIEQGCQALLQSLQHTCAEV